MEAESGIVSDRESGKSVEIDLKMVCENSSALEEMIILGEAGGDLRRKG